jgi:hypothetical protein
MIKMSFLGINDLVPKNGEVAEWLNRLTCQGSLQD